MTTFIAKRIYDPASKDDGYRVLVDRLWPRGVSKEEAKLDEWAKVISPSPELRVLLHEDNVKNFPEFSARYHHELSENADFPKTVEEWEKHPKVTLLFGSRDRDHNEAVVLTSILNKK